MMNPMCDGGHCRFSIGPVRVLPTGTDSNAILCRECYEKEIEWRRDRNKELSPDVQFDIPVWERLRIYKGAK